jgi:hypothetical protein
LVAVVLYITPSVQILLASTSPVPAFKKKEQQRTGQYTSISTTASTYHSTGELSHQPLKIFLYKFK